MVCSVIDIVDDCFQIKKFSEVDDFQIIDTGDNCFQVTISEKLMTIDQIIDTLDDSFSGHFLAVCIQEPVDMPAVQSV